ncbi:TPA: phage lysis protein [Enterobacter bugandensis]|nr:phage lysis protein [Enterobacter bugandensis]
MRGVGTRQNVALHVSDPVVNGDLSADISRLEHALAACALQIETVKDCQDKLDEESNQPAQGVN